MGILDTVLDFNGDFAEPNTVSSLCLLQFDPKVTHQQPENLKFLCGFVTQQIWAKFSVQAICHNLPTFRHEPRWQRRRRQLCRCLPAARRDKKNKTKHHNRCCVITGRGLYKCLYFFSPLKDDDGVGASAAFEQQETTVWKTKQECYKCNVLFIYLFFLLLHWCLRKEFPALVWWLWRKGFLKVSFLLVVWSCHLIFFPMFLCVSCTNWMTGIDSIKARSTRTGQTGQRGFNWSAAGTIFIISALT